MKLSLRPEPAIRPFLVAVVALFVAGVIGGIAAPEATRAPVVEVFHRFVKPIRVLPPVPLFLFIFFHNLVAAFASLAGGVLLGVVPIVSVAFNGFLLGVIVRNASTAHSVGGILVRLLPHGVFELPAYFVAAAYGLWLGWSWWAWPRGAEPEPLRPRWRHAFRRFVTVVVPLLLIAAAIETSLGVMLKGQ